VESVPNKVELDAFVKRAVCAEARQVVYLDEPGLKLLVYHDIHAEDLEAHRVLEVVRLTRPVGVRECRLHSDHCFHANVFNTVHHLLAAEIWLVCLNVLEHGGQRTLRAAIVVHI